MSSTLIPTIAIAEVTQDDLGKVGDKAMQLASLARTKVPIPACFVVTSESYFYFLDMARIREKIVDIVSGLDYENGKELEQASTIIQDMIIKASVPPAVENALLKAYSRLSGFISASVAVRSSITYDAEMKEPFTGLSSTFLNIKGGKDLMLAVKASWASLFETQAIYYRMTRGISHMKVGMAVVIQKMVQSEVSGLMHTTHSVGAEQSVITIDATLGLYETGLEQGITGDHYEVEKETLRIVSKNIAKQIEMVVRPAKQQENGNQIQRVSVAAKWQNIQKLDDRRIKDLAVTGKMIEQLFGSVQTVEWSLDSGRIYILQATPDTPTPLKQPEVLQEHTHEPLPIAESQPAPAPVPETEQAKPMQEQMISQAPQVHISQIQEAPDTQSIVHSPPEPAQMQQVPIQQEPQIILSGSPASEGIVEGIVKIVSANDDFINLNIGDILVIEKVIPDYILWIKKAGGIITNQGGITSHAAILAREFKIPCIVGTENATQLLHNGEYVRLNGTNGRVYAITSDPPVQNTVKQGPEPEVVSEPVAHQQIQAEPAQEIEIATPQMLDELPAPPAPSADELPEKTEDFIQPLPSEAPHQEQPIQEVVKEIHYEKNVKTATKIFLNISDPSIATQSASKDTDGIGYINGTDILNEIIRAHPESYIESEIVDKYVTRLAGVLETFCKEFNPRQVIYRPSNLVASELTFNASQYESQEVNPKLGYNGAVKYIQNPSLFNLEVETIKTVRNKMGYKNLSIMLPMIRDEKDLREIKKIITSNDLKRSATFKVFLPIEAPSTVLLINQLIEIGIDGIFIFAKTLSGLVNAVDLDNPKYKNFNVFNEAFMLCAEVIIKTAHKNKIPAGLIIEEKEPDESALKDLLDWGAMYVSIDPYYLDKTKQIVAKIERSLILSKRG